MGGEGARGIRYNPSILSPIMPVTRAPERARAASATRVRRLARACGALVVLGFAAFCVLLLLLRYVVMPQVPAHRDAIAGFLSHRIGAPVTIDALATAWDGWNPKLVIDGFRLRDPQGTQSVLELPHVELVAAWTSLAVLQLRLKALAIERPMLAIARDADGVVHVAGLEFDPRDQGGRSPFLAWLLRQREISVRDAVLAWTDELRAAPTVTLTQVDVKLENELGHHRFGATGVPPAALASPFDVRGDLTGIGAGTWQKAKGRLYLRLDYADVAAWRTWVPLPLPIDSGTGALRLWFDVADMAVTAVVADAELADVRVAIESSLPPLELQHIVGRLQWQRRGTRSVVSGHDVSFTTKSGDVHALTDFGVDVDAAAGGAGAHGTLTFARADLAPLAAVAAQLPLPAAWREELATRSPHGAITGGRFTWQGPADDPAHWTAHGTLVDVGASARGAWPGIARLSGTFDGDDVKGSVKLATRAGAVEVPGELRDEVKVDRLDGTLRWTHEAGALRIDLDDVAFANADAAGAVSGSWRALPQGPGHVELNAQFTRGNIARIANYVPVDFNAHARDWLRRALVKGDAGKGLLALKGNLADFPFSDAHPGVFTIAADVHKATLDYADGWPPIDGIDAVMKLDRTHLRVEAAHGSVLDADIGHTVADIPDLAAPVLSIQGTASGAAPSFLQFVRASPVADWTAHVADGVRGSGDGVLTLSLVLPLTDLPSTRADGTFALAAGSVDWPGAPAYRDVNGKFAFTRQGIAGGELNGTALGGTARITFAPADDGFHVRGSGTANLAQVRGVYPVPFADRLSGTSDWALDAQPREEGLEWTLRSSLQGATVDLPAPFAKAAAGAMPVSLTRHVTGTGHDMLTLDAGSNGRLVLRRRIDGDEPVVERALLVAGSAVEQPGDAERPGLWIRADLASIDVDDWLALDVPAPATTSAAKPASAGMKLMGVDVAATRMTAMRRRFRDLAVGARREGDDWQLTLRGRDIEGTAAWYVAAPGTPNGRAVLRLARLALPREANDARGEADRTEPPPKPDALNRWPEVDVDAEHFASRGRELGRLKMRAKPNGSDWLIESLALANDGGTIATHGAWHVGADGERTDLEATFDVRDAGTFLARFGYPDEIRGAPTKGTGRFTWPGAPSDFDYRALNGSLTIAAGPGQFLKIEPGIGKLLGVLSLQALPRRITLDFRDVFSEGFAFDEAKGEVSIVNGVLRTDAFKINGTSARIDIKGDADIARETQALDVHVQPSLATGVSAGAAALLIAANPVIAAVVGAGTLLAQKALKDPIEQMFSYEYRVTGSWSDPVVARVGRGDANAAAAAVAGATPGAAPAPAASPVPGAAAPAPARSP